MGWLFGVLVEFPARIIGTLAGEASIALAGFVALWAGIKAYEPLAGRLGRGAGLIASIVLGLYCAMVLYEGLRFMAIAILRPD